MSLGLSGPINLDAKPSVPHTCNVLAWGRWEFWTYVLNCGLIFFSPKTFSDVCCHMSMSTDFSGAKPHKFLTTLASCQWELSRSWVVACFYYSSPCFSTFPLRAIGRRTGSDNHNGQWIHVHNICIWPVFVASCCTSGSWYSGNRKINIC